MAYGPNGPMALKGPIWGGNGGRMAKGLWRGHSLARRAPSGGYGGTLLWTQGSTENTLKCVLYAKASLAICGEIPQKLAEGQYSGKYGGNGPGGPYMGRIFGALRAHSALSGTFARSGQWAYGPIWWKWCAARTRAKLGTLGWLRWRYPQKT